MTKGELVELMSHMDDDTEILAMSAYDLEDGGIGKARSISEAEEMDLYRDGDGGGPVIVLLYNDEED